MTNKLKACPNVECRSDLVGVYKPKGGKGFFYAYCIMGKCNVKGPNANTEAEATTLWNALPRDTEWIKIGEGEFPKKNGKYWAWDNSAVQAYYTKKRKKWAVHGIKIDPTHYKLIPDPGTP